LARYQEAEDLALGHLEGNIAYRSFNQLLAANEIPD